MGHSSTSISAAVGMSEANKAFGLENKHIAVIGDGALTAGMAFEALNHAGNLHTDVLVIFNDNNMSISNNVGALSNYFSQIISGKFYTNLRQKSKIIFKYMPFLLKLAKLTESNMKAMVSPSSLFEALNFNYIGPIDGHNINVLIDTLQKVSKLKGPQFLHISTTKGKGFTPAENNKIAYHAVKKHSPEKNQKSITGSNIFGKWICDKAKEDKKLIGITPAMREGSDLVRFSQDYPQQYFDVGISEQHCLTFAAGLAVAGMTPVVAIYSTFLQRAYDQLIHDICLQNLNVTFAIDRAGLVGEDGPTHAGSFDISFLSCIPNIIIMTPSNHNELYAMLNTAYNYTGPAAVRYPRGACSKQPFNNNSNNDIVAIGTARSILQTTAQWKKIAILNFGHLLDTAKEVSAKLNCTLVDMRFVKPLDKTKINEIAHTHDYIITIEENSVLGGAGSNVSDYLNNELNINKKILNIGLPDKFIEHKSIEEMRHEAALDCEGILNRIQNFIAD